MASTSKTKGIILKMADTPGKDKLVFILTEKGILKAFMTPKKFAGKKSYTIDLFSYGEIVYFTTDSGNNLINSITPEEYFYGIREDIDRLYAAGYFASLAIYTAEDAMIDSHMLMSLVYHSFLKLSNGTSVKQIKPAFELIISELLGVTPCLEASEKNSEYYFALDDGRLYIRPVPSSVFVARSVVIAAYKILNTSLPEALDVVCDDEEALYKLSEQYILYHVERNFDTLKYLNGVI